MLKSQPALPSDAEFAILNILWRRESATAKEIHEELNREKAAPRVVTTTAKLLQIMMGKGSVARDESSWPHAYYASIKREPTLRRVASETLNRAFNKSASQFLRSALEAGVVSQTEIAAIKSTLESYEHGEKGS